MISNQEKQIRKELIDKYGVYVKSFILGTKRYFVLYYFKLKTYDKERASKELYCKRIFKVITEARKFVEERENGKLH